MAKVASRSSPLKGKGSRSLDGLESHVLLRGGRRNSRVYILGMSVDALNVYFGSQSEWLKIRRIVVCVESVRFWSPRSRKGLNTRRE
jgi:hypothetical protein